MPENTVKLGTGGIPSPRDYRDDIAATAGIPAEVPTLPAEFHTDLGPVLMQGQTPACVSHSITYLIKLWWYKKTGEWVDFSPRFLDILSAEADIPLDGGRRPRTVLKVAAKYGICTTAMLPNDVNLSIADYRNPAVITQAMRDEAAKYKIPGYVSVALDLASTRTAIYLYGAISTLFTIGDELWTAPNGQTSWADKDIDPLRTPVTVVGGHQMTPNGWGLESASLNRLRNSWSEPWANHGEADYDPLAWLHFINEQWAIAEIPNDLTVFLASLPSAADFHYQWDVTLKYGDFNDDVKMAQVALLILGYLKPFPPAELGHYGPKTAAAVLAYQHAKGIAPVAPNFIGPKTRAALNADFAV